MKARFLVTGECRHRGQEVRLYPLLTSAVDGSGWSAPRPGRFTPRKDPVPTVQEVGWALVLLWRGKEKIKIPFPHRRSNPNPSGPQPVAILTTNVLEDDSSVNSGIRTKLQWKEFTPVNSTCCTSKRSHAKLHCSPD